LPLQGIPLTASVRVTLILEDSRVSFDLMGGMPSQSARLHLEGKSASRVQIHCRPGPEGLEVIVADASDRTLQVPPGEPAAPSAPRALAAPPADWMGALPGDLRLDQLSIPGTHDTCAFYGGPLIACQRMPLKQQLEAGIRFLDIRCKNGDDKLYIYHGIS